MDMAKSALMARWAEAPLVGTAERNFFLGIDVPELAFGVGALPEARVKGALRHEVLGILMEVDTVFAVDTGPAQPVAAHLVLHEAELGDDVAIGALSTAAAVPALEGLTHVASLRNDALLRGEVVLEPQRYSLRTVAQHGIPLMAYGL